MSDWLVLKPIPVGGGKKIEAGAVVQADGWRNRRTLESGRYIQKIELTPNVVVKPIPVVEPVKAVEPAKVEEPVKVDETVKSEAPKKKVGRPPKVEVTEG